MASSRTNRQPRIAVVGIAARLPSGEHSCQDLDYLGLWDFLYQQRRAYVPLADLGIQPTPFTPETLKGLPARGTFLKNTADFDYITFGINKRDACTMPFAARHLVELSFLALLDAGIDSRGQHIGCFMTGNNDLPGQDDLQADGSFSYVPSAMANRISYMLNITGPSFFVDTACSSSLTALHLAVSAIEKGDCSAALVGGAQSNRRLGEWRNNMHGGILAADGISKPFSTDANGFARAEGAIVIVLKLLEDAVRDHDHIYSVIAGTAISSGGSHMPIYVPSSLAYHDCIRRAYTRAGRDPRDVDYYEAHATGTQVGDPIEINAAGELFATDHECLIGSIKSNIGHMEMAAFLGSLLKVCHIFDKGVIPPHVNVGDPNANITWERYHLRVPTDPVKLPCHSNDGTSVISISSGGHGGSFGHVVLESPPTAPLTAGAPVHANTLILYIVGGLSPKAVDELCQKILDPSRLIQDRGSEAVKISRAARQCTWRTYIILPLRTQESIPLPQIIPQALPQIGFVFNGQGVQHVEMGRQLFQTCPIFRQSILEMDDMYRTSTGHSFLDTTGLFRLRAKVPELPLLWPVEITLPAIAMLQIALYDTMVDLGLRPGFFIGHSAGETSILYASGAGSKEMAIDLAIARGKSMMCTEMLDGGMASFGCSEGDINPILSTLQQRIRGNELSVACFNSPNSITLAGPLALVDEAVEMAKSHDIFAQRIRTKVPGHSPLMELSKNDYDTFVVDVFSRYPGPHVPRIPVYSTALPGTLIEDFTVDYFWANTRNPVRFSDAINMSLDAQSATPIIVEIGAHPALSSSIESCGIPASNVVCPMRRVRSADGLFSDELRNFLLALGQLATLGINTIDLTSFYGRSLSCGFPIPYPFHPRPIPPPKTFSPPDTQIHSYTRPLSPPSFKISSDTHPLLAQHVVGGQSILPATAFIEILLEAGATYLWDVEFRSFLPIYKTSTTEVHLQHDKHSWTILSCPSETDFKDKVMHTHARGNMDSSSNKASPTPTATELWDVLRPLHAQDFYERACVVSAFGPSFRRVVRVSGGPTRALAEVEGPTHEERFSGYILHPAILDACLHFVLHPDISRQYTSTVNWLPLQIGSFELYTDKPEPGNWFSYAELVDWDPDHRTYNISVQGLSGNAICSFRGIVLRQQRSSPDAASQSYEIVLQPTAITAQLCPLPSTFDIMYREEVQQLLTVLDALALQILEDTLAQNPSTSNHLDRQRYRQFAENAIKSNSIPTIDPTAVAGVRRRWPTYFEVTERVRQHHYAIFTSPLAAVNALYSDDLMSRFYGPSSILNSVCLALVNHFRDIIVSIKGSGKRVVRILEVGAGTGLLTRHLTEYLSTIKGLVIEYVVTDISLSFARDLARKLPFKYLTPKAYDLNKPFRDQGFSEAEFDIIVALDVLHAAPRLHTSLNGLRLLLAEGGTLLATELDGSLWSRISGGIWHDFVFGSFSEWFGFEDERQHCALTPQEWRKILQEVGFYRIQTCTEAYGGLDFIFSAQTPNGSQCHASSNPQAAPVYLFLQYRAGEEIEIQGQLLCMDPYTRESICLVAGVGSDGDAAAGLTISLIQEFELWDIRLAIFEDEHDLNDHRTLIGAYRHLYDAGERILYFPVDNKPFVRRIVPCLPNPNSQEVKSTEEPSIKIPGHNEPDILIHSRSTFGINIEVIIGQAKTWSDSSSNGDMVAIIGAVEEWKNTRVQVASASSLRIRSDPKAANDVLASCVAFLCLNPVGAPRILVALSNQDLSQSLHQALTALSDVNVDTSFTVFSPERRYDVIVTDSATATHFPHIRRWLSRSGNLFHWEDEIAYLLDNDANMMKATLSRCLLRVLDSKASVQAPSTEETVPLGRPRINPVTLSATSRKSLFDGAKAYLLLGGVGGLGIELALWMYRFGARHLVLSSRRGPSSVEDDELALKKLSYLRSREDLHIFLISSDATNETELRGILSSLESPLGGVFMLTLALSDSLFVNQTSRSFQSVRDSKLAPLSILSTCVDINNLEFCIAFSSLAGVVGTAGQTNYSSACTALDGAMNHYHNAFSIAVPGILDAGYLVKTSDDYIDRTRLTAGGITSEALFSCVCDGILRIQAGMKVSSPHIPDIDWVAVAANTDLGPLCRHLTIEVGVKKTRDTHLNSTKDMLKLILELIDVPEDSFDNKQPLTSYGVDSICAARISNALRPHTSVSQMQILGGISWDQIQSIYASTSGPNENGELDIEGALAILLDVIGILEDDFDPSVPLLSYGLDSLVASRLALALAPFLHVTALQLLAGTSWTDLMGKFYTATNAPATHQRYTPTLELPCEADLITELRGGDGTPLILIHDLMGSILALQPLKRHFTNSPLWAIQVTQGVPLDSFSDLVKHYHDAIREKQPAGPYRLASFSGTSIVCLALVRTFEDAGEEVGQLGFIDHFPVLWACPAYRLSDIMSNPATGQESKYRDAIGQGLAHVAAMRRSDPYTKLGGLSEHAPASAEVAAHLYERLFLMTVGYLQEIRDGSGLSKPIATLLSRIRAPITVFVATDGIVKTLPSAIQGEWKDLGAGSSYRVRVVYADKGHYGILDDESVAKELELARAPGIL